MSKSPHGPLFESDFRLGVTETNCVSAGDPEYLVFTTEEVDRLDHAALRRLAAESSSDEINGKSTALELQDYFRGQTTLHDFADSRKARD